MGGGGGFFNGSKLSTHINLINTDFLDIISCCKQLGSDIYKYVLSSFTLALCIIEGHLRYHIWYSTVRIRYRTTIKYIYHLDYIRIGYKIKSPVINSLCGWVCQINFYKLK